MAFLDRDYDSRLTFGNKVNPLIILIGINMIVFVVLAFFRAITTLRLEEGGDVAGLFNKTIFTWFALSPRTDEWITRPWTLLTQGFTHISVLPVLANMLWLWCFSYVFIDLTGNRKLIPVYLYGTLVGSVAFILTWNLGPSARANLADIYFFGADAGVLAVCAATTATSPGFKIFPMLGGGIPIWIVSLIYVALTFASSGVDPATIIANAAALLSGYLFIVLFRKGYDLSGWMNNLYDRIMNSMNPEKPRKPSEIKKTYFYETTTAPFKKTLTITQQRLDEILDKINQRGFNSLSQEEQDFLQRASQEDLKS